MIKSGIVYEIQTGEKMPAWYGGQSKFPEARRRRRRGGSSWTSLLNDGNTVAWYDYKNVIKDAAERVSQMTDKSGNGNHLLQDTAASQPLLTADGVLFDGVDDCFQKAFTLNQPYITYLVVKATSDEKKNTFVDGFTNYSNVIRTSIGTTYQAYSGGFLNQVVDTGTGFAIISATINKPNSFLVVNGVSGALTNEGINADGITVGAQGALNTYGSFEIKEIIVRKSADSVETRTAIYNGLKKIHSL